MARGPVDTGMRALGLAAPAYSPPRLTELALAPEVLAGELPVEVLGLTGSASTTWVSLAPA
eukprot:15436899-Alexandrium_andersonii.AAC.1